MTPDLQSLAPKRAKPAGPSLPSRKEPCQHDTLGFFLQTFLNPLPLVCDHLNRLESEGTFCFKVAALNFVTETNALDDQQPPAWGSLIEIKGGIKDIC